MGLGGSRKGCVMNRGGVQAGPIEELGPPYAAPLPAYIARGGESRSAIAYG
jgi:hypothetical protein